MGFPFLAMADDSHQLLSPCWTRMSMTDRANQNDPRLRDNQTVPVPAGRGEASRYEVLSFNLVVLMYFRNL
jgi:hypothetical protein